MKADVKELIGKILNTPIVVESGVSGIWNYRKWSDGTAECWGVTSGTTASVYGQNGGQYSVNFPFTFSEAPVSTVSLWVNSDAFAYACWISTSTTAVSGFLKAPSVGAGYAFAVYIHTFGKWK